MKKKYHKLSPDQIFEDIIRCDSPKKVQIKGLELIVYPHVYPSDKFRTTNFILENIEPLFLGSRVCDMGCGIGVIGLFALHHSATTVVQADINPIAVENAKANRDFYKYSHEQIKIFESNCFDQIPKQIFDIIIFNVPFHSEPYEISDPLEYAFHDPNFISIRKFLHQVVAYCNSSTKIFIAFSNKGDIKGLERIFQNSGLNWSLWKTINADQEFDNRLYQLGIKSS